MEICSNCHESFTRSTYFRHIKTINCIASNIQAEQPQLNEFIEEELFNELDPEIEEDAMDDQSTTEQPYFIDIQLQQLVAVLKIKVKKRPG